MQILLLVSDCSRRGVQAVGRIAEMVRDMAIKPDRMGLIVNRAPGGVLNDGVREEIEKQGLTLLGVLPQDEAVFEADCAGQPSSKLPADDPMKVALAKLLRELGI